MFRLIRNDPALRRVKLGKRTPGYFDTNVASNGGTESVNGLIELHRRVDRGFRNRENYRLRMLLIGGGLDPSPHTHR
ncbi:hypothetical protein BN10_1260002 [Phycicoccus elongatus Lp2]|uniref:Transposase IS204/IS1001/IS1096/IS1165 DDE domain-containing protein n=1 Tax=Phycicoccus elongatus Lp2 TaxID=1193181 RepID=N0DXR1_9MICO|nr:hypothetical protein BN10_1260002 [Phycicoccus elongatus Lp2]